MDMLEKMISGVNRCFPNGSHLGVQVHGGSRSTVAPELDQTIFSLHGTGSSGNYGSTDSTHEYLSSLFCSLCVIKEKVHQVQSLLIVYAAPASPSHHHHREDGAHRRQANQSASTSSSSSIALASNMGTLIQEIIATASSMMFSCQQMAIVGPSSNTTETTATDLFRQLISSSDGGASAILTTTTTAASGDRQGPFVSFLGGDQQNYYWYGDNHMNSTSSYNNSDNNLPNMPATGGNGSKCIVDIPAAVNKNIHEMQHPRRPESSLSQTDKDASSSSMPGDGCYDIIELEAEDLLAKYTHFCPLCGKGFKRDANLRMHMRAHGDEYKSHAALRNPSKKMKNLSDSTSAARARDHTNHISKNGHDSTTVVNDANPLQTPRKLYSCPQVGCRWNKKHAKFQPLKSMICVKNHYKRSHCPKMYVCKRCNRKQFSVLSDLKTHEKHCGILKWQCSCGTTFSRKDKLMGHCALFAGHSPMILNTSNTLLA